MGSTRSSRDIWWPEIVSLDKRRACRGLAHGRMAKTTDRHGADRHEPRPPRYHGADGPGPVVGLIPAIALIGIGIGASWAFIAQRVMRGAKSGEESVAAASVATVQQVGIALGAALAGLIANASGFVDGLHTNSLRRAAFWVPMLFVAAPLAAATVGVRSNRTTIRPASQGG